MAVYAIGDIQGCYDQLCALLELIEFDPACDRLWFAGDLVNRGPQSLPTLRFIKGLGSTATVVLGNHDLHVMALSMGLRKPSAHDHIDELLNAPDREELFDWLRFRPLLHHDAGLGYTMVHAGMAPQWDLKTAQQCAREIEQVLQADDYQGFIVQMYGDEPARWNSDVKGVERWRFIINSFTRLRYCDEQGRLSLVDKSPPGKQAPGLTPWFNVPGRRSADLKIIFGHWSALGRHEENNTFCLDSGCIWGGALTAMRLDSEPVWTSLACPAFLSV